jgi:hypothetical protein
LAHRAQDQAGAHGRRDDQFGITGGEDAQMRCARQPSFFTRRLDRALAEFGGVATNPKLSLAPCYRSRRRKACETA